MVCPCDYVCSKLKSFIKKTADTVEKRARNSCLKRRLKKKTKKYTIDSVPPGGTVVSCCDP